MSAPCDHRRWTEDCDSGCPDCGVWSDRVMVDREAAKRCAHVFESGRCKPCGLFESMSGREVRAVATTLTLSLHGYVENVEGDQSNGEAEYSVLVHGWDEPAQTGPGNVHMRLELDFKDKALGGRMFFYLGARNKVRVTVEIDE